MIITIIAMIRLVVLIAVIIPPGLVIQSVVRILHLQRRRK